MGSYGSRKGVRGKIEWKTMKINRVRVVVPRRNDIIK